MTGSRTHISGSCRPTRELTVRRAAASESGAVSEILSEAARWLEDRGIPLWPSSVVTQQAVEAEVRAGRFFLACAGEAVVGAMRLTGEDPVFWPEAGPGEALYVHRMAVRRDCAGGRVSTRLLRWAAAHARSEGYPRLRLDCEASRPRLCAVYERFGFVHHSDRRVGPFRVARYEYALPAA